ncbi:MAG: hypothetical protein ACKOFH_09630, partial [Chthoniobacterales bacterium]
EAGTARAAGGLTDEEKAKYGKTIVDTLIDIGITAKASDIQISLALALIPRAMRLSTIVLTYCAYSSSVKPPAAMAVPASLSF